VRSGDAVLDLGSGGGKICYMAARLAGTDGRVTGVDMNDDMLTLARKYQAEMAGKLGGDRVRFVKGYIQDLALDIAALGDYLAANPVRGPADYTALRIWEQRQRRQAPLIADASIDLVISNCVLNLVADHEKPQLVQEIFRVLKPGGRIAISDIVSDRIIPQAMKQDPELWSGCISGAFEEGEFAQAFAAAGSSGICYDKWDPQPWRVIENIAFRAVTLTALKPPDSHETAGNQTVMYRGPFAAVIDETGRCFARGNRETVSADTRRQLMDSTYRDAFIDLSAAADKADAASCCGTTQTTDIPEPEGGNASHGGCCG
jgi:ubiquinone/menaquinone biosynthesis C-methylase UbiE